MYYVSAVVFVVSAAVVSVVAVSPVSGGGGTSLSPVV